MTSTAWNRGGHTDDRTANSSPSIEIAERATIGASVVIKGEVSGTEPLFIDGRIEGSISFPSHRVTVGRSSHIHADIRAHDVVVMGSVEGNIFCEDLLDIRAEGQIHGNMTTQRIQIDDGAVLKGSVEVNSAKKSAEVQAAFHEGERRMEPREPQKERGKELKETRLETAAAAVSTGGGHARRVPGSQTLIEPTR